MTDVMANLFVAAPSATLETHRDLGQCARQAR